MKGLVVGRVVYLVLNAMMADAITRRRTSGESIRERMEVGNWPAGAQAHIGTIVAEGDVVAADVTHVWDPEKGIVNVKAKLDGTDCYWATSVGYSSDKTPGTWHWMFDGQAERYTPAAAGEAVKT